MTRKLKRNLLLIFSLCIMLFILTISLFLLQPSESHLLANVQNHTDKINVIASTSIDDHFVEKYGQTKLEERIDTYLSENGISTDSLQYCIEDLETHTRYTHDADQNVFAASVHKLPLAMIYYEKINNGEFTLDTLFTYEASHYEIGGPIGSDYQAGDQIPLSELLHDLIIYSDNTAGHILFENLGGWISFKETITKYSNTTQEDYFYSGENVLNASYVSDVLAYLYTNSDQFTQLLTDLKNAKPNEYLAASVDAEIAQKYGNYDVYNNVAGIVYGQHPYSIMIFTSLGTQSTAIGDINAICYAYFNDEN